MESWQECGTDTLTLDVELDACGLKTAEPS